MRDGTRLDQLFLKRQGGQIVALLVSENLAGARFRTQLTFPTQDFRQATERLARHLARGGEVGSVAKTRIRVEKAGELHDEPELKTLLEAAFRRSRSTED